MARTRLFAVLLSLIGTGASAAPGELSGAIGGGSKYPADDIYFTRTDKNGNGVIDKAEARAAGIERFDAADKNADGVLDQSEFSALEFTAIEPSPGDSGASPAETRPPAAD